KRDIQVCFSVLLSASFFQAEDGMRDFHVTGVQTCALPILVLMGAAVGMMFLGGVGLLRFTLLFGSLAGMAALLVWSEPYRLQRLTGFLNPWNDPYGTGYQLTQALIAFGRGEWLGVGLGNSIQKQFYLPEAHTDFVFSVLAEELGMVGALAAFALLVFIAGRALYI